MESTSDRNNRCACLALVAIGLLLAVYLGLQLIKLDQWTAVALVPEQITLLSGSSGPQSQLAGPMVLSGTPVTIVSSVPGVGMGSFQIAPVFSLDIPAVTHAAAYVAEITVQMVSGP